MIWGIRIVRRRRCDCGELLYGWKVQCDPCARIEAMLYAALGSADEVQRD